jgi:hypothetical protein
MDERFDEVARQADAAQARAADRAATAHRRQREIDRRLEDIRQAPPEHPPHDEEGAHLHAREAEERAAAARASDEIAADRAIRAHERAAERHLETAEVDARAGKVDDAAAHREEAAKARAQAGEMAARIESEQDDAA